MASPPEKDASVAPPAATSPYDDSKDGDVAATVDAQQATTQQTAQPAHLLGVKSPGVQRAEAISQHFRQGDRVLFFIGLFLVAYAYGLDGTLRVTYQVRFATSFISFLLFCAQGIRPFLTTWQSHTRPRRLIITACWQPSACFVVSLPPLPRYVPCIMVFLGLHDQS